MPPFAQLLISKSTRPQDPESNLSYPVGRNVSSGIGIPLGLRLQNGSEARGKEGGAIAPPKNLYIPLAEHETSKSSRLYHPAARGGIQRTVSIELTSN